MPTFVHGKSASFKLDNASNTLTDITDHIESVDFPQEVDMAETSTIGTADKTFIVGLKSATITINGRWSATLDAHLAALVGNDAVGGAFPDFEFGPAGGTASANTPVYRGKCLVSSFQKGASVGDPNGFTLTLQISGSVTRAVA
jgi:hypothetical protein